MSEPITLTEGSLDLILGQRCENLRPTLQLLGTKLMTNGKMRAIVYDGKTTSQHCILYPATEILPKYTIILLEEYSVTSLPKRDDALVIVGSRFKVLKDGKEVRCKWTNDEKATTVEVRDPLAPSSSASIGKRSKPEEDQEVIDPSVPPENICPINVLTPYYGSWCVRALVLNKSQIRTYNTKRGEGRLFNFELCDESGEIRVTCFNEECDRFFNIIVPNKIFLVARGTVKPANKQYSNIQNDYEITLNKNSFVKPMEEFRLSLTKPRYKFVKLLTISRMDVNTYIDFIGIIRSVGNVQTLVSKKTLKELKKREVVVVDRSLAEVRVTMWDDYAEIFGGQPNDTLAVRGAVVQEFRGKVLNLPSNAFLEVSPEIPETQDLKDWYSSLDPDQKFIPLSRGDSFGLPNTTRYLTQIDPKALSHNQSFNFNCVATVQAFNRMENHLYKACSNCNKKVTNEEGLYNCSKCQTSSPTFSWRMMMNVMLSDASGSMWVTMFHEHVEKMLGKPANELALLFEKKPEKYSELVNDLRFKTFSFRINSRLDTYNNEVRVRHNVSSIKQLKPKDLAQTLMKYIKALNVMM